MKVHFAFLFALALVLACFALAPRARADETNQMTKMTFRHAVEVPGQILPAGTYWFVLGDLPNLNVVEVYNSTWSKELAVLFTATSYRQHATARTEVSLAERPHNRPKALLKWFYPGRRFGHEFLYSQRHEREFARDTKVNILVPHLTPRS
jgi:hypothetical protein